MAATGRPMGRPSKPVEVQRALGNPGHKTLPVAPLPGDGIPSDGSIPVAAGFGVYGSALWDHVWEAGRQWLAPEADRSLITMLCHAQDELEVLRVQLATGEVPRTYVTSNGTIVSHPYIAQIKDLRVQMTAWLAALGFSPSDRARLGLAEVRVRDELDELVRRRNERAATA